jgi:hypothetical protein
MLILCPDYFTWLLFINISFTKVMQFSVLRILLASFSIQDN